MRSLSLLVKSIISDAKTINNLIYDILGGVSVG